MSFDFLTFINAGLGVAILVVSVRFYRLNNRQPWHWVKLMLASVGLIWFGIYLYIILAPVSNYSTRFFGSHVIRSATTYTLGVILASGCMGYRRFREQNINREQDEK